MVTLRAAVPVLPSADVPAALAYLTERLGFTVDFSWGSPATYAAVERDGAEIHVRAETGSWTAGRVAIVLDGVDGYHAEVVGRGADVAEPPADQPYGMREFTVRTPDGHLLGFAESLHG